MALAKSIAALLLAFALVVANTLQPSEAIRVPAASKPTAAAADHHETQEQTATTAARTQLPGALPAGGQARGHPLPQLTFDLPGVPSAGQLPGFPLPHFPPLPGFPLPPAGQFPGFPFPLPGAPAGGMPFPLPPFPPLFPLPPAGQVPGFPFPPFPPLPSIPGSPLPPFPPLPSIPGFPGAPAAPPATATSLQSSPEGTSPRRPPPSQLAGCLTPLMGLSPCIDYLTKTSVGAPPSTCCDSFKVLVNEAPVCLCHGLNGDISKIMPAPMDFKRMISLPATCGVVLPLQTLPKCSGPVPPLLPAQSPFTAPSPDPSP